MSGTVTPPWRNDPEIGLVKLCPRCREEWPYDAEFFMPEGTRGLSLWCRACICENAVERRAAAKANRYGPDIVARPAKPCSSCRRTLPLDRFFRDHTRSDGRSYVCTPCFIARRRARRAA